MREMRFRPKDEYLHTATWEDLYILTDHWSSEMEFYRDELRFLKKLIGKYFIWLTRDENLSRVQRMATDLNRLDQQGSSIAERIKRHLKDISLLMENAFSREEKPFRDEHVRLEEDIAIFVKEVRGVKRNVFTITEHVIESEKLKHLLQA